MAPKDRIAQYFGLFALTGKVTSFIGPMLIGAVTAITASQKAGMAVLVRVLCRRVGAAGEGAASVSAAALAAGLSRPALAGRGVG